MIIRLNHHNHYIFIISQINHHVPSLNSNNIPIVSTLYSHYSIFPWLPQLHFACHGAFGRNNGVQHLRWRFMLLKGIYKISMRCQTVLWLWFTDYITLQEFKIAMEHGSFMDALPVFTCWSWWFPNAILHNQWAPTKKHKQVTTKTKTVLTFSGKVQFFRFS